LPRLRRARPTCFWHALGALGYRVSGLHVNQGLRRKESEADARGLYRASAGTGLPGYELALIWVLNQSDGGRSLLDVAERAGLPFSVLARAADEPLQAGRLAAVEPGGRPETVTGTQEG
jgi:hypothetical protein